MILKEESIPPIRSRVPYLSSIPADPHASLGLTPVTSQFPNGHLVVATPDVIGDDVQLV